MSSPPRSRPVRNRVRARLPALAAVLAAALPGCFHKHKHTTPPQPMLQLTAISPTENPIDGLGVPLTVRGSGFDADATVWFDTGTGQVELATALVDAQTLTALAPRELWHGTFTGFGRVFVRRAGQATAQFAAFNYYGACGNGSETGPFVSFVGNANGSTVRDATNDELRFRASDGKLVVDGVVLGNTRYNAGSGTVTIDGNAVGRLYTVPSLEGPPILVLGNVAGTRVLDQTRGAVDTAAERDCHAWSLRSTPFTPTAQAVLGAQLAAAPAAADAAPCPSVAIERDASGEVVVAYGNLRPDRLYVAWFELACDAAAPRVAAVSAATPSQFVAAARSQRVSLPDPMLPGFAVMVRDVSDGFAGCGAFALAAPAVPPRAERAHDDATAIANRFERD